MGMLSRVTSEGRKLAASRGGTNRATGGRRPKGKTTGRRTSTSGSSLSSLKSRIGL